MRIEEIIEKLALATEHTPVHTSSGWMSLCPAHEDEHPSLSISVGQDEKVLIHCHAGCSASDICAALGINLSDLFIDKKPTAKSLEEVIKRSTPRGSKLANIYTYIIDSFVIARFDMPDGGKRCLPFTNKEGNWRCGAPKTTLPLYQVNNINSSEKIIYVCEGEKCVDSMTSYGFSAITSAFGANTPHKSDWSPLDGKNIVILPDNDRPGDDYAKRVKSILHKLNPKAKVKIAKIPGLPEKGDFADWVSPTGAMYGKTKEEIEHELEKLEEMPEQALVEEAITASSEPSHCTDSGNAQRFIRDHGSEIIYVPSIGWIIWNGKVFERDEQLKIVKLAKETALKLTRDALKETDPDKFAQLIKHAQRSQNKDRIAAMISLAQCEVAARPNDFDASPVLFNVSNGTIDLTTGQLRKHDKKDKLTKITDVIYDPEAKCPRWMQFLEEITQGDKDLQSFLQKIVGLSLTGDASEHVLFIFYGNGANGKSTFIETILFICGKYAGIAPPNLLQLKNHDEHPTELADLMGRRLVVASETDEGRRLDVQLVKQLTGDATIKARFMRQDFFEFPRTFKLVLCTNNRPEINETSTAIWRRICLVPFNATFPPETQDKKLSEKLKLEAPGILRWAVEGCLAWQKTGLLKPDKVLEATNSYRAEEDDVRLFIDEICILSPKYMTRKPELFSEYEAWSKNNGSNALLSRKIFYDRVAKIDGVTVAQARINAKNTRVFRGLALKSSYDISEAGEAA